MLSVLPATLEARDLTKRFTGPPLFSGLSFRIESGLLAITGRNGSGKTTLLKILASLLRPESGAVHVTRDERELSGDARRLAVGWAGPDLFFYEDFTAFENLLFFHRVAGLGAAAADLESRLGEVGLAEVGTRRVGAFSTGMKQRLRIAFALLFDPPILLLDEPMAGLDSEGRAAVQRVVSSRRREGSIVLASNDSRDFAEPDRVLELGQER